MYHQLKCIKVFLRCTSVREKKINILVYCVVNTRTHDLIQSIVTSVAVDHNYYITLDSV